MTSYSIKILGKKLLQKCRCFSSKNALRFCHIRLYMDATTYSGMNRLPKITEKVGYAPVDFNPDWKNGCFGCRAIG